jgi:aerobic-type carbon monoxide dehydrogenase small subunit (CoxS/CutS family)
LTDQRRIALTVNGRRHEGLLDTRLTLVDLLRHDLGLTGTHVGCEHGVCGACTVLLDGVSIRSCLMLAVQTNGREVTTVEGLAGLGHTLNPLQQAFWEKGALQCGFCTPGILLTLTELLAANSSPTEDEVRDAISGNLCRCTGYQAIIAATMLAAARMRGEPETARGEHGRASDGQ